MNATDYLTSNLFRAEDLDRNLLIHTTIISAGPHEFDDGVKLVVRTDVQGGKGFVCNQTRLKALIAAYGPSLANWPGREVIIRQGMTVYSGKDVPCIVVEAVVADRIAAGAPAPRIESEGRRGPIDIRNGRGAWEAPPPLDRPPDSPDEPDSDIPF